MQKNRKIAGLMALIALASTAPAMAQSVEFGRDGIQLRQDRQERPERRDRTPRELTERQAIRIAKGEGVREVEDVTRDRSNYDIEGKDRNGDDIEVVVDRVSGEVISVE